MKKVPFNCSNELTVKDIEGYYIRHSADLFSSVIIIEGGPE